MSKLGLALSFMAGMNMAGCDSFEKYDRPEKNVTCDSDTFRDITGRAQSAINTVVAQNNGVNLPGCPDCTCNHIHQLLDNARLCLEGSDPPQVGILDTIVGNMFRRLENLKDQTTLACGPGNNNN